MFLQLMMFHGLSGSQVANSEQVAANRGPQRPPFIELFSHLRLHDLSVTPFDVRCMERRRSARFSAILMARKEKIERLIQIDGVMAMEAPPHGSRKPPRAAEAGPDTTRGQRAQAERRAARESAAKSKQEHNRNTPGTHRNTPGTSDI